MFSNIFKRECIRIRALSNGYFLITLIAAINFFHLVLIAF